MGAGNTTRDPAAAGRWPVMVLAHNEERHIVACLDSIFAADPDRRFDVFVMANGCTDRTVEIVRQYGVERPEVRLVSIALGDKCNAWNVFIHETAPASCPGRDVYFFMDGDARAAKGSFAVLAGALQANPHANAASSIPASGRNAARDQRQLLERRGLYANLYALRGSFVERLRAVRAHLPLKLEGDDGLISALVKWDLAPGRDGMDHLRIVPCADAAFEFESLSLLRLADWKAYWKRTIRYGRRSYEFQLLLPLLEQQGLSALPADITELYAQAASLRLKWNGIYTVSNLVALWQMRRIGRSRRA